MNANPFRRPPLLASSRLEILRAALVAFTLGAGLVYLAGFAYPNVVHNAAHDSRHSLSFPCHCRDARDPAPPRGRPYRRPCSRGSPSRPCSMSPQRR